jgi:uncharacterized RDD family membrane protein YckC
MSWYYAENNERRGPIEDAAFQTLVASGTIKPETLVWRDGLADWIPYRQAAGTTSVGAAVATANPLAVTGSVGTGAAACSQCGRLFSADDMVNYQGSYICAECKPLFFQKIKEGVSVIGQVEYAGFWIRVGASILDGIILNIVNRLLAVVVSLATNANESALIAVGLVSILINAFYMIYFVGKYGATPGKMACKIEIIRADGSPVGYGRATGRYFAQILNVFTLGIGYLMVAFDEEKRGLHDRICDTRVIRKQQR